MNKKYNFEGLYKAYKDEGMGQTISLSLYKLVLREFYKEISKEILKGYILETILGKFLIASIKRRIKLSKNGNIINNINWGESNKKKSQLEQEGKLPLRAERNEEGEITGDNGGEEWLCYFVNDSYFSWLWQKNNWLVNQSLYQFRICKANRIAVPKTVDENSTLLFQYRDGNYKKNIKS